MRNPSKLWLFSLATLIGAALHQLASAQQPGSATQVMLPKPMLLKGHKEAVGALAFSPDGKILASAADETVKLWDVATGQERFTLERSVYVPIEPKRLIEFSPNGKLLATACSSLPGRSVKVWDVGTGKALANLKQSEIGIELVVAFSPDGRRLACGDNDGVSLWDTASYKQLGTVNKHEVQSGYFLNSLVFSPDGKTLATAGHALRRPLFTPHGELKLWDVATLKEQAHLKDFPLVRSVAFSPDGKLVAAGVGMEAHGWPKTYGETKIWDAATGRLLKTLEGEGRGSPMSPVGFSPKGDTLVTVRTRHEKTPLGVNEVTVWNVATWKARGVLRTEDPVRISFLAFAPDGSAVFTGMGASVWVWNTVAGKQWMLTKEMENGSVVCALSPDGKKLAMASSLFDFKDGTVRVWNIGELIWQKTDK